MSENRHTAEELKQWQALPLGVKVQMTLARIRAWVNWFGEEGVYVSFSGGKDSTVLSHLVDRAFPGNEIPRVFVNTGLEFPEIVQFVKKDARAVILRPKLNFKQVIEKYGYPFISKEVSQTVYEARKTGQKFALDKMNGKGNFEGSRYSLERWAFMLQDDAPPISHKCCAVMKKNPTKEYEKDADRKPMLATMAEESLLRRQKWIQNGCNAFECERPRSTPMAFWTENDVLQYIKDNNVEIAPVYGQIIADVSKDGAVTGQMRLEEFIGECGSCKWRTTGARRTGCMFCGFGAHLDRPGEGRFVRMKKTHPKIYEWIMKPWSDGGLGYKYVIDWINEHGGTKIEY